MPDAAAELAAFAAGLSAPAVPGDAERVVRADLLDTLGCALAGRRAHGVEELLGVLTGWGGSPESCVWGQDLRLPAPAAALLNGTAAHALDFDDTHDAAVLHAGVTVVPAVLAAAERRGGLPWDELLCAITVGLEVACRLGAATTRGPSQSGWLLTPLCGTFGAAAGAARALGLDVGRTRHALGIAYAQAAGNGQATLDRALTKRMQAGFAARSGVLAAVLAGAGITGARDVFEGARGFFTVYQHGAYDRSVLLAGLGERFRLCELTFKPYPCCRWTHAAIDAALDCREQGVAASDVRAADALVSRQAFESTGRQPAGEASAAGIVSAQFSVPFAVAVALHAGAPRIEHFTATAVSRADLLALAARVRTEVDPDPARADRRGISSARLVVTTRDGRTVRADVERPQAGPADEQALRRKFVAACDHAGVPAAAASARADLLLRGTPDATEIGAGLREGALR